MIILRMLVANAMSPVKAPVCEEKSQLLRAYSFAASDYSRAVMVLNEHVGIMRKDEYEKLRRFSEKARQLTDDARQALERHTAEHGC